LGGCGPWGRLGRFVDRLVGCVEQRARELARRIRRRQIAEADGDEGEREIQIARFCPRSNTSMTIRATASIIASPRI